MSKKTKKGAEVSENTEQVVENTEKTELDKAIEKDSHQQALTEIQAQLDTAEAKAAENWEKFLAAKAEADNVRKRAERDVANAHKYALEKFIPELLTVKDSLELGVKNALDSVAEEPSEQMSNFIEGSEMTVTMLTNALEKVGVTMVNPEGETFNPEFHQAMTMVPSPDVAPNTIIEVIQKGYTLNERLLRPAMVIVSKAG